MEAKKNLLFEPQTPVSLEDRERLNYGLNKTIAEVKKVDYRMTPEMQNIINANRRQIQQGKRHVKCWTWLKKKQPAKETR